VSLTTNALVTLIHWTCLLEIILKYKLDIYMWHRHW